MKNKTPSEEVFRLVDDAVKGDKTALESLLTDVQDMVFNLSLRMLGTIHDAEDATQEILVRVMTNLASFRKECAFSTWVFKIAANHLKNYKKSMFANRPLSFEYYSEDILNGNTGDIPDMTQDIDSNLLADELKMSCTNVMLQCLDVDSRCVFILGTMFKVDSRTAGDILGVTPEAYRQKLSRVRRKMADFLREYCGEYGGGTCRCVNRVNYAIQNHRISPAHMDFNAAAPVPLETILEVKEAMEAIDELSEEFSFCKTYQSPEALKQYIQKFLEGPALAVVRNGRAAQ